VADTTTVRVDTETHAKLSELAEAGGTSLIETVRDAAEALRRQRFASQVAREMAELRADPEAWRDYEADMEATTVPDGVRR
jgi:predicted transcriptional regulator